MSWLRSIRHQWRRLTVLFALVVVMGWYALPWSVAWPVGLTTPQSRGRVYLAADGSPLRHLLNEKDERVASPVAFADLPEVLIHATLAAEDKRFFSHGGVDLLAVARAVRMNAERERVVSGASTITQQLVKISASTRGKRTLATKVQEALQARQLEMRWSKPRILETYLNRISYGNQFIGCAAAAQGYFRKPLRQLTAAEAAYLAAIPQAPGRLNPFQNPAAVIKRQQLILDRMWNNGWLSDEAAEIAKGQPLVLQRYHGGFSAPHAVDLDASRSTAAGNEIRTTIDAPMQERVETIVANRLAALKSKRVHHAAVVVLENETRALLALVGSRDYHAEDGGQINGAWVPRSAGSTLKPLIYALAFQNGGNAATIVADLPIEYQTSTGIYRPENYDKRHYGPMTYRYALGNSLNIPAVRVLESLGGAKALTDLLQQCGLTTLTEAPDHYGLGLAIGNAPVRLLELTNAYATLASQGIHRPWTLRQDETATEERRVLDADSAWLIADILADNQARVMTFGTRSMLRLPFRAAVKTGTSTSYRDNWTIGYTPEYTVGVWAGNFQGEPMNDVSGVTGAAPIFRDVFEYLQQTRSLSWFHEPSTAVRARIDPRTGRRISPSSPAVRLSRSEVFVGDLLPPAAVSTDYEAQTGKAILPAAYRQWVDSTDNWLGELVTTETSTRYQPLVIQTPLDGTTILLDPDVPGGDRLLLRATPADEVEWLCDTLRLTQEANNTFALLKPGTHRLAAVRKGESSRVTLHVKAAE
jgi:penicillin-binding protein 1C